MKFTTKTILTVAVGVFTSTTLAGPLALRATLRGDVQAAPRMTAADRFSISGLDYMTWANKMVAEGKMYWPKKTSTFEIQAGPASFSLQNVVCGFIGASQASYQEGETKFCDLISKSVGLTLLGGEYILQNGICEDNQDCTLILDISFGVAGGFAQDAVPSICAPIFEELYNNCNGAVGGSAQLSVSDSEGTQSGDVGAQFYDHDSGAVCPATTDTNVCGTSDFN